MVKCICISGLLDSSYCWLGDYVFIFICRYFIIGPLGIFNITKIFYYHLISHVRFMCDDYVIHLYQKKKKKV